MQNTKDVTKILDKMTEFEIQTANKNNEYIINNKHTTRVTEILSAMLHEDSLMSWSNNLGWKRISYKAYMREAADKGTYAHLAIEKFLKEGKVDINELGTHNPDIIDTVISTMTAFHKWWNMMRQTHREVKVHYLEEKLVHKYFGGTCDCLLNVDGEFWLVDFKTSNRMNYNYALQLSAYRFLLRELRDIEVSRCVVLKLDKVSGEYNTYELDLSNSEHSTFLNDCECTFLLLAAAYKMRLKTTDEFKKIFNIK